MADLDYRFDKYTEQYQADELQRVRRFARQRSLPDHFCVEIGANRGRFLAELARRRPKSYVLGVEWTQSLAEAASGRLERNEISNADVVQADINHLLPVVVDDGQLDEVFVLYPDPWWKTRHRKRRIIQPDFLDRLAKKLTVGGTLWIRTDVGPFADDMRATLAAHHGFEPLDIFEFPMAPLPRSTRERHVVRSGIPVHVLYYERVD